MVTTDRCIGLEIADGRYKVLGRVGEGSMGHVYRAYDAHLETDVVIKFPAAADAALEGPEFLERFAREVRSLVHLSHPHIVKIIDVGAFDGRPYVVMQYLAGGSLKDRLESGPGRTPRPMPPHTLSDWLMEVAKALDFIHGQDYLHRDVKPANILFDRHGNAFLGDFGIIKAVSADREGWRSSTLTAPGFLLGTPNYVAPEIVMGQPVDGKVDQYSLAMTVHEVLIGSNFMAGPTPSATVVNQTQIEPPPLSGLVPGVPKRLSDAILRGLAKDPRHRFANCASLAREILAELPIGVGTTEIAVPSTGETALEPLPGSPQSAQEPVPILYGPDDDFEPDPKVETVVTPRPDVATGLTPHIEAPSKSLTRLWLPLGFFGVAVAVVGIVAGRWLPLGAPPEKAPEARNPAVAPNTPDASSRATATPLAAPVKINIAYGTEKKQWLEQALEEFRKVDTGTAIEVNLLGMGSVEGAQTVLDGPKPVPIHVWSPASSAYRDVFESEWRIKHGGNPILKAENLALTPMVFVMWKERHDEFIKKYHVVNFRNVAEAMHEMGGWSTIANKPEWGLFKFGHTHPNKSNSGLLALVLMAYEFSGKQRHLDVADVVEPKFQTWFRTFEHELTRHGGSLTNSTGTMMQEMVLRGPSQYDCLVLYENLAIDYMRAAEERWGELAVDYPEPNLWNEHPYYILDVPWSNSKEREAARHFLDFLMSEPIQRKALEHGFRPGNPSVPVKFPNSPLVRHAKAGLRIAVPTMGEPPKAEVVRNLLSSFQRIEH